MGEEEAARGSGIPGKSRPGHGRHRGADRGDPAHLSAARPRSPACRPADTRDDRGTRFEATQTEDDGTLRVVGHDTGAGVSDVFGTAITSYEWVYVVPSGRVNALARALSAEPGDDVMDALAGYYHSTAAGSASFCAAPRSLPSSITGPAETQPLSTAGQDPSLRLRRHIGYHRRSGH